MTTSNYPVNAYLLFNGRCGEAIEFYEKTLGAKAFMTMHYKDAPAEVCQQMMPPGWENKVMHARMQIGNATVMAADGPCEGEHGFKGFSMSLTAPNPEEAERLFKALSDGGKVSMPLQKTFFSPAFGMVADKFGVPWMIYVEGHQ